MKATFEKKPCKILIVDDNRIMRHLLKLTFANVDHFELFEADCAEKALPIVIQEKPVYIILDIMMSGGLDGFELCHIIKSSPDTQQCKVILLSARSQQDDFARGKEVGADFYITKPFSPADLLTIIDIKHQS